MVRYENGNASVHDVLDSKDPRVELETRHAQVVWDVNFVEATPQARNGLERKSRHDLNSPWPARSYSLTLLRTALLVHCDIVSIPSFGLCVFFSALYAIQLECTKEADAEGDGYWLPLDLGILQRGIEPRPKRLFPVEVLLMVECSGRSKGARWGGEARMWVYGCIKSWAEGSPYELARAGGRHDHDVCMCDVCFCYYLNYLERGRLAMARRRDDGKGVAWCGKIHMLGQPMTYPPGTV